jgi:putative ABC transport system ATP-binding protein
MIMLERINRSFLAGDSEIHALQEVDLQVGHGEYLSIMGPSGSGKSTLLNLLGLLDRQDSGSYLLDGQDTSELDEAGRARLRLQQIGFIFQAFHLVPRLTAFENIELPMMLAGINIGERRKRVTQTLEQLRLVDRQHHRPDQLSGGQRQRTAIARAIVMQPQLLLADEPTGNLDQHSGGEVIDTLEQLNQQGITLLVVTHDPQIGQRARRQIRMVDGRISQDSQNRQNHAPA